MELTADFDAKTKSVRLPMQTLTLAGKDGFEEIYATIRDVEMKANRKRSPNTARRDAINYAIMELEGIPLLPEPRARMERITRSLLPIMLEQNVKNGHSGFQRKRTVLDLIFHELEDVTMRPELRPRVDIVCDKLSEAWG
jgi:hypothetical protein